MTMLGPKLTQMENLLLKFTLLNKMQKLMMTPKDRNDK